MHISKISTSLTKGLFVFSCIFSTPVFGKIVFPPQDYVETIRATDFYSNRIDDTFLSALAKEYKSYALFKANYTPDYNMANYFAMKAINAYHGENVSPENVYKKNLPEESIVEISNYYDDLLHLLQTNLKNEYPELMAEAQAKFDCWVDSESNGLSRAQSMTCQNRFMKARKHLFEKLNNSCNCKDKKKTKITKQKTIKNYDGKILAVPKWPNLPLIPNNPPIPVIKQTVIRELTISKEIKESINRIEQSIIDLNAKIEQSKTNASKSDIDALKQQIEEIKRSLENSENFDELQNKLKLLEEKLSNISCSETQEIEKDEEKEAIELDVIEELPIEEYIPNEEETEETEDDDKEYYEEEEETEEESEEEETEEEEEEEPEFETIDEDEYIEIEISNTPSQILPFEVMFEWNKSDVNPSFLPKLKEISENVINSKEIIVIKGHTDASGTPEYNQKLSKKRAENVGKIIMSYGVPKNKIILQGVGSTEPKVPTKAGERNAQNRRVVIK